MASVRRAHASRESGLASDNDTLSDARNASPRGLRLAPSRARPGLPGGRKVRRSPLRWVSGRRCPARRRRRGWRGGKTSRVRAQRSWGVVREDHSGSASKRRIVRMFMWTRHTSKGWRPKTEAFRTSGRLVETLPPPLPRSMNVPRTHLPGVGWIAASRGRPAAWDSKAAYKEPKPVGCHGRRSGRCMLTARRSADHPLRHGPLDRRVSWLPVRQTCRTA